MARGINAFVSAKPLAIAVLLIVLLNIVSCTVLKVTDELPTEQPRPLDEDRKFMVVLQNIMKRLDPDEMFMNDQPAGSTTKNVARTPSPLNHTALQAYHLDKIKQGLLKTFGRSSQVNQSSEAKPNAPLPSSREPVPNNCLIVPAIYADKPYQCEAMPPICPIFSGDNITIDFNISDRKPYSREMILKVVLADLKLYKVPLKRNSSGQVNTDDEPASDRWRETFERSHENAPDRLIRMQVDNEKMLLVTVYKVRNKNKKHELKPLDTRMVKASGYGITTWNVKKAVNIWGNETRKTLKLVITVHDDGKPIPARDVFPMRCGKDFYRPVPIDDWNRQTEKSYSAWMNLATVELPARTEAVKGVNSVMTHLHNSDFGDEVLSGPNDSLTLDDE